MSVDFLFVSMPFAAINRPALGASILKQALTEAGITSAVTYPCLDFARDIGLDWYREFLNGYGGSLMGEWLFAPACYRDEAPDDAYLARATRQLGKARNSRMFAQRARKVMPRFRRRATALVERAAQAIVARRPRIVGCTSTFEQHVASLAVLRRVGELDARIVTCIGGSNCEGPMGVATMAAAPWVDYVVSGEADELIVEFARAALRHGATAPPRALPSAVLSRAPKLTTVGSRAPRAIVDDLDATPVPDFSDFFSEFAATPFPSGSIVLPIETARGCWWGQKSHCTFCGLLGEGMRFRQKSQDRSTHEVSTLVAEHDVNRVSFVDNILAREHFTGLIPALRERGDLQVFFETKASMKRTELEALADAGVVAIQPGIETLHDGLSQTMKKGNATWRSVQTLKWARELGVYVIWNLLVGVPGADDAHYEEMADRFPLLFHLQPPSSSLSVMYERFSPYHERPADFGLALSPAPAYASIYPVPPAVHREIAYLFEASARPEFAQAGEQQALVQATLWQELHVAGSPPVLTVEDDGHELRIHDTRPCAVDSMHALRGVDRAVYLATDLGLAAAQVLETVRVADPSASIEQVDAALEDQIQRRLSVRLGRRHLALGVGPARPYADAATVALLTGDCPTEDAKMVS